MSRLLSDKLWYDCFFLYFVKVKSYNTCSTSIGNIRTVCNRILGDKSPTYYCKHIPIIRSSLICWSIKGFH